MNKTESLQKLKVEPDNLEALETAGDYAVIEKKYNIALNLYGRYLKIKKERKIFIKISEIYIYIQRNTIACIYLKAALDIKYDKLLEEKLKEIQLKSCKNKLEDRVN